LKYTLVVSEKSRLSVSISRKVSNVFMLSIGGISPPPSSVASLIFLQAENTIATVATIAMSDKTVLLFFTKKIYDLG
jgi:hypothetical protein